LTRNLVIRNRSRVSYAHKVTTLGTEMTFKGLSGLLKMVPFEGLGRFLIRITQQLWPYL